ncbi:hypothetical protein B9M40_001195 [Salmonella enterica subsp. enterica serovar Praha]|nr:hypothetical protein [Salmonella enterica]ECV4978192.1 hypothetical protein [Salmonella enterica subsp. enterica serovar Praha]ECW2987357.1 hypothetical protein [Salmonella enterica subsp. enterica serovar Praha]EDF7609801.1 hypothetical protein [Salmonella enterica]EEF4619602.1 hypothetical protein [Salmonella enterica]
MVVNLNDALYFNCSTIKSLFLEWVKIRENERKTTHHKNIHIKQVIDVKAGRFAFFSATHKQCSGEMPDDFFYDVFGEQINSIKSDGIEYPVFITYRIGDVEIFGLKFSKSVIKDTVDSCFDFFELDEVSARVICHALL